MQSQKEHKIVIRTTGLDYFKFVMVIAVLLTGIILSHNFEDILTWIGK